MGHLTALPSDRVSERGREADEFAALFDNVPDPTLRYEIRDGVPVVDAVNTVSLSQFGMSADAAVGTPLDAVVVGRSGTRHDDGDMRHGSDTATNTRLPEAKAARRGERIERRVDR